MPSTCGSFPCSLTSGSGIQDGERKGEQLAVHPSWQKSADKSTAFYGAKQWWRRWLTRPCDCLFQWRCRCRSRTVEKTSGSGSPSAPKCDHGCRAIFIIHDAFWCQIKPPSIYPRRRQPVGSLSPPGLISIFLSQQINTSRTYQLRN